MTNDPHNPLSLPFHVRRSQASDGSEILALLKNTVGETDASQKTEAFWRWKHQQNRFGESYSVCAVDESVGVLVGLRTMMWWEFSDPAGDRWRAVRPVDTATHPEYQRRGIFSVLTKFSVAELRSDGVPFIFNTPNENSLPGYLKMGWEVVARWPVYARPCRPIRLPWEIFGDGVEPRESRRNWSQFARSHEAALADIVERHEAARDTVGYRTVRDTAYLKWRYGGHPDIHYEVVAEYDNGELVGVLIGRSVRNRRGYSSFVITELFLRNPSVDAAVSLLRTGFRELPHLYVIAHFSEGTIEQKALRRVGFLRIPGRGYTFAARSLAPVPWDPVRPESWDLTLGELEIF